jgi:DNA polymerase
VQGNSAELFEPSAIVPPSDPHSTFTVSAKFVELAQSAILNRDPERFALLYRLLWRLRGNHDLLMVATDPDVSLIAAMVKAVHRDQHKMKAFVRFREVGHTETSRFIAWFEPEHHIVEATAQFFARRFADMAWSILTPDACAHWDGDAVTITTGVSKARGAIGGPAGTNLAQLLRQHLQPGTSEGESHANRDAEKILAEPAGSLVD